MKITVIIGSPKSDKLSITMKHVEFIINRFPDHEYRIHAVSRMIRKIEKNAAFFETILSDIRSSSLIIWAFPVYFYMVPGQLKRFIEMVFERNRQDVFHGKYATAILTSGLIYDHHAHDYIHAISEDLGMKFIDGFSFNTVTEKDLLKKEYQKSFVLYFEYVVSKVHNSAFVSRHFYPLHYEYTKYEPETLPTISVKAAEDSILILTDQEPGGNLENMVQVFTAKTGMKTEIVNLNDLDIKSGCLGCVRCQYSGQCIIQDDVRSIFSGKMLRAAGVVFAVTIKDRHFSSEWKCFLDRSIYDAKKPIYRNKYIAYLFSGPLTLFEIEFVNIYSSTKYFHNVGFVSDNGKNTDLLTAEIGNLADDFVFSIRMKIRKPPSFYSRAYHMSVRDVVYSFSSAQRSTFAYFRKEKLFDYPHKKIGNFLQHHLFNFLFNLPGLRNVLRRKSQDILVRPYEKIVNPKVKNGRT
ncbi:MAG: NAD(P)H-dependent oxidoreductase [Spirochaetales bacterium]|nr:NAD(P)H-dependent oxidoreductase [Spirochaetales bacterium]